MYRIDYWQDGEEIHFTILDEKNNIVYQEDIIGDWDNEADIQITGLEISKSKGYWPASYNQASILGKRGGNATAKKGKKYFSEIGKKGAKKRWAK